MKRLVGFVGLGALVAMIASGCGQKNPLLLPNQPPEVEIFAQRVEGSAAGPSSYRLQWSGHDPDGVIASYLYSIGPPASDARTATWAATAARSHMLSFAGRAASHERAVFAAREPSVFSVMAVDGAGARSAPARVAFFDGLLAPSVRVTQPAANQLVRYSVPPTLCVEWEGTTFEDSTGASTRIVEYKYIMLHDQTAVTLATARVLPDSVRRYYAPRDWEGWTSVRGNVTSAVIENLVQGQEYGFVITVFDDAGNYDPLFSWNKNMVYMRSVPVGAALPRIGVFSDYFLYEQALGRRYLFPDTVHLEVPAGQPLTFNWYANPVTDSNGNPLAGPIRAYRWGLDLTDVQDPRQGDPAGHSGHWTRWGPTTSATVGPFGPGETHYVYIEASGDLCDVAEEVSLLSLELNVVQPSFDKDLLIVDDTRYLLDRINAGTTCDAASNRPTGNWPTQAELDTFLYARGGVPWRCYPPVGGQPQLSSPGVFNGYRFDTLGTNLRVMDLTVPLSTLVQYRHVIWLVDARAALNNKPGTDPGSIDGPTTSLRYMNDNRRENTLAAYVRQGGKVWLAGGGAATASMMEFNRMINDNSLPIPRTLTFRNTDNELVPGRFVYDQAHWRSEFKQFRVAGGTITRYLGRFEASPGIYASLPDQIRLKSPAIDPFPPNRTGQSQSVFYQTQFDIEFLSAANEIFEDADPRPPHESFESRLDSVYKATAPTLRPDTGPDGIQSVVMTHYHGQDNAPFVLTGFNLWNFRRSDCVALADFVLQQLWGLTRQAPAPGPVGIAGTEDLRRGGPHGRPGMGRASAAAPAPGRSAEAARNE